MGRCGRRQVIDDESDLFMCAFILDEHAHLNERLFIKGANKSENNSTMENETQHEEVLSDNDHRNYLLSGLKKALRMMILKYGC